MKASSGQAGHWYRRITLLTLLFMLMALVPFTTTAQDPTPTPEFEIVDPDAFPDPEDENGVTLIVPPPDETTPIITATPTETETEPGLTDATESETGLIDDFSITRNVQGVVQLSVLVTPDQIRSENLGTDNGQITYTYVYTNTGSQTASNVVVRATWSRFNPIARKGNWQYCDNECNVASSSGPTVEKIRNYEYRIGDLPPNQSGRFSVRLRTMPEAYSESGKEPVRPAGSGQLLINNRVISENTANALVVGPIFYLAKERAPETPARIYPLDTGDFIITMGNASGPGDVIDGQIRADARAATNIVLVDTIPAGSEYVPADGDGNPEVNTQKGTLTWRIAGPLQPNNAQQFRVRFRKLNVSADCGFIRNQNYSVTSDQMPFKNANERYDVKGKRVDIVVINPLEIKSITAEPRSTVYGNEALLTIVVQNFYDKPIAGSQLIFTIQSNAFYVPNSATPNPAQAPSSAAQPGGEIRWNLDIPPGTITAPTEATFSLRVIGDYNRTIARGTGVGQVVAGTSAVPLACAKTVNGRVNLVPRLSVGKFSESGELFVTRGQNYAYLIEIKNDGSADADNVTVIDNLPSHRTFDAKFSYVRGSATLDDISREPDSIDDNKNGGNLIWNNISVPRGEKLTLRYELRVDGFEFVDYCNKVEVRSGDERINITSNSICVRINPDINLEKIPDKSVTTIQGDTITFRLRLTNQSSEPQEVGLYDPLGSFVYVKQDSGYAQPELKEDNVLEWPLKRVAPGDSLEAVIVTRLPNECKTAKYVNELMFRFKSRRDTYIVRRIPPAEGIVQLNCGTNRIEYSKKVDRERASLQDRITYTLEVKNNNRAAAINNVTVVDILPPGFTFVSMVGSGDVTNLPQQKQLDDERIQLTWVIPSIQANRTARIVFVARTGNTVLSLRKPVQAIQACDSNDLERYNRNWLMATAPDLLEAIPRGGPGNGICSNFQGAEISFAYVDVNVEPLHTAEPKLLNADTCATPGNRPVYQLSLVNTNDISYESTTVTVTLPLGLKFVRPIGTTPAPTLRQAENGDTLAVWQNLTVPAKRADETSALVVLESELEVGQVWHDLPTKVTTTSPNGAIPLKDGVLDPTIRMCPPQSALAKMADREQVAVGEEFVYQISIVNTETSELTVSIEDQLPPNLTFVAPVGDTANPIQDGNRLTWNDLRVPRAETNEDEQLVPGVRLLRFRVRAVDGEDDEIVTNKVVVINSSPASLDTSLDTAQVRITKGSFVYLPLIQR